MFPQARTVGGWLKAGWHVALGYVAGFAVLMLTLGWHPHAPHKGGQHEALTQTLSALPRGNAGEGVIP
jgi:hypothetical protein